MKLSASLGISLIFLMGCVTIPMTYNYFPQGKRIDIPALRTLSTAYVGEQMLRQGISTNFDVIEVKETIRILNSYTVSPGYFIKSGDDKKKVYYSILNEHNTATITNGGGTISGITVSKIDNEFCIVGMSEYAMPSKACDKTDKFEQTQKMIHQKDSFQRTLLYSGKIGDKISISYREFSGGRARQAFTNNVEYDLSESAIIGYKNAQINVIEATNQYIRYEVIKSFK